MEKYFIKIDIKSIKRNKNAGSEITRMNAGQDVYFECDTLPGYFKQGQNCMIEQCYCLHNGEYEQFKGYLYDDNLIDKAIKDGVNITVTQKYHSYTHSPIPFYSFKYENTKVNCYSCEEEIMTHDIKTECKYDGYDEYYSNRVCPKCGQYDCVILDYEKIDDALRRAGKINFPTQTY